MAGHLSIKSLRSTVRSENDIIATERWNIEKERRRLDDELAEFYEKQLERCKMIREKSNTRAVDIYEKLLVKVRWALPPLSLRHRKVIIDFCEHLLGNNPTTKFPRKNALDMCKELVMGTTSEKMFVEIEALYRKIEAVVLRRERCVRSTKKTLMDKAEDMVVSNDNKLRWMMETNVGRKDRYWTIWNLTNRGMMKELRRLVESSNFDNIDERDPDFGYTALHFACKNGNLEIVQYLISKGADILLPIADGRTPLHLAAQYGTKEIVGLLLQLGAYFEARDQYGCLPIDLAHQSRNDATFGYLDHWNNLLPPEPPPPPPPPEDLSHIPEEFHATPQHIFMEMSLPLQMLTRRLDGTGKHSYGEARDPRVDMRLCEKQSLLCMREGLKFEAYKSLRRRWHVVKQFVEFQGQFSSSPSNKQKEQNSTACDHGPGGGLALQSSENSPQLPKISCFGPCSVMTIGRDLAEVLIKDHFEGFAFGILKECVDIVGLEQTTQLTLYSRICEVGLFVHDELRKLRDNEYLHHHIGQYDPRTSELAPREAKSSSVGIAATTKATTGPLPVVSTNSSPMATSPSSRPSTQGKDYGASEEFGTWDLEPPAESTGAPILPRISPRSRTNSEATTSSPPSRRKSSASMNRFSPRRKSISFQGIAELNDRMKQIVADLRIAAWKAVAINMAMHRDDVIEPCTLVPLIEFQAEVLDRESNISSAIDHMEKAEVVASRSLGYAHEETIRIMLLGLKLMLKSGNVLAYKAASKKATDMSRRLDVLASVDPVASDRLARRCAEVIALSRLLEDVAKGSDGKAESGQPLTEQCNIDYCERWLAKKKPPFRSNSIVALGDKKFPEVMTAESAKATYQRMIERIPMTSMAPFSSRNQDSQLQTQGDDKYGNSLANSSFEKWEKLHEESSVHSKRTFGQSLESSAAEGLSADTESHNKDNIIENFESSFSASKNVMTMNLEQLRLSAETQKLIFGRTSVVEDVPKWYL